MSLDKLRELVAAATKATPGPWATPICEDFVHVECKAHWIAQAWSRLEEDYPDAKANCKFIAAARNAIPDLESLLSRHEALKAAMREKAAKLRKDAKDKLIMNDGHDHTRLMMMREFAAELEALAED